MGIIYRILIYTLIHWKIILNKDINNLKMNGFIT